VKTFLITFLLALQCVTLALAAEGDIVNVEVDQNTLKYRVSVRLHDVETEFDYSKLVAPSSGLAPWGLAIQVKDESGKQIPGADSQRGYASSALSSGDPFVKPDFRKGSPSGVVVSDWLEIANLLRMLDGVSNVPMEDWAQFKITASMVVRDKTERNIAGESDWIVLTPAMKKALKSR
jgi:hypothetical protein